jgi:ABC-2 type transport system permease protein
MRTPGFVVIFWRDMLRFVRFRTLLLSSLVQPALWMAFFGIAMSANFNLLTAEIPVPSGLNEVNYLTFMSAGVIAMTTLFTSLYGGITLLFDKNWGLLREVFASPLRRTDIIIGIGLSVVVKSVLQALIILGFGILLGVQYFPGYSPSEVAVAVAGIILFVTVFALGFVFLSSAISITMESPEGLQGVITLLTMPIFFASNALYPIEAFPDVLMVISAYNPLTFLVNGLRYFAIGDSFFALGKTYSYGAVEVVTSLAGLVVFTVLMFSIALWRFRRAVVT